MTTAYLYRQNNHYTGFEIDGHADYASDDDIVCAAISISSITALNALELLLGIEPKCEQDELRGYLKCVLPTGLSGQQLDKSPTLNTL
ncbi:MAG: ribosomal-processing cysteine protease Prp [Clostridiales bacterium]|nr:MAG: ribosomal-processing cysteine protease Prp [Clostridiales bacterium]